MTDRNFEALRLIINLARNYQIRNRFDIKTELSALGFTEEETDAAFKFWADYTVFQKR